MTSHRLETVRTITSTGSPLAPEELRFRLRANQARRPPRLDLRRHRHRRTLWRRESQRQRSGAARFKRGRSAMKVEVFDEAGRSVRRQKGELVCTMPFPSMPVGFWNDPGRPQVSRGVLRAFSRRLVSWRLRRADRARRPDHLRAIGRRAQPRRRAHRHGGDLPAGRAARRDRREPRDRAAVGRRRTGRAVRAAARRAHARTRISRPGSAGASATNSSPRHVPARIVQVTDIPRTKSGKLVELAVRDVVHGRDVRNREALANPEALEQFRNRAELAS